MTKTAHLFAELNAPSHLEASDKLLRIFEDIHNHIYANDGLSSQQVFEEILEILFIKIFDEKNNKKRQFYITDEEYEDATSGAASKLFLERVYKLKDQAFVYFSDVLNKNEKINLKTSSLAYTVNKLQKIDLSGSSRDVKGLAFQKFVYSKQRSDRGQFFTPEQIVSLCVKMLKPTRSDVILDPACGSAGFLSQAMKYVYENSLEGASDKDKRYFVENNIFGIEINPTVAKLAKMRMILDGDGFSNIIVADSLSDFENLDSIAKKIRKDINLEKKFSVILTNPPFGSQGKIINKNVLKEFDLGHKWEKHGDKYLKTEELLGGQVPDILFIERCLDLLKDGGRMAIVLPNGDLENSSLEYVRYYISERAKLLAVISLPFDTFIPFGTGVKASILFLRKGKRMQNDSVFFGKISKIGYKGNKNGTAVYRKDKDGELILQNGLPQVDEDTQDVVIAYDKLSSKNFKESDVGFVLPYKTLSSRFDVSYYLPSNRALESELLKRGCKRLGNVVDIVKRKPKLNDEEVVRYVELSDVIPGYAEISSASEMYIHELPSRASYLLKEGDIITAVAGNSIGTPNHASALVMKDFSNCVCTNGFRLLKTKGDLDPYYLLFFLRHEYFLKQVFRYRTGAAIPSISDEDLLNILIYYPPKSFQQEIADKVKSGYEIRKQSKESWNTIKLKI